MDDLHARTRRLSRCAAYSLCPEKAHYNSPGQRPGLVYDIPLGLFDDAADHTHQEPSLPADFVPHP
jgi:hypothetical protein